MNRTHRGSAIFPISRSQRPEAPGRYMIFGPLGRHLGNVDRQPGIPRRWRVSLPSNVRVGERYEYPTLEAGVDALVVHLQDAGER